MNPHIIKPNPFKPNPIPRHPASRYLIGGAAALLLLVLTATSATAQNSVQPQSDNPVSTDTTCPTTVDVATFTELSDAITCFNSLAAPGVQTINVTTDITLSAPLPTIDNATADVELQLNGQGNTLDADQTGRVFDIADSTVVGLATITLTGGNASGTGDETTVAPSRTSAYSTSTTARSRTTKPPAEAAPSTTPAG